MRTPMQDVQVRSAVCPLAGVHAGRENVLSSFIPRNYAGHALVGPCTAVDSQYASKWAPHSYP